MEKKFLEHLAYSVIYLWYSAVFPNSEISSSSQTLPRFNLPSGDTDASVFLSANLPSGSQDFGAESC